MDLKRSKSYKPASGGVETLGPVKIPKKSKMSKKNLFKATLVVAIVLAFGGSAYLLKQEKDKNANYSNQINSLNGEVSSLKQTAAPSTAETAQGQTEAQPSLELPVVVFTPDGVFSAEDKKELDEKVIKPMVDYNPDTFVSINIEIYSQDKFVGGATDDKYIITTVGKPNKGGTGGFIYGSKTKGIDWWVPECLDKCDFSEEFKAKYPEVIKKYEKAN